MDITMYPTCINKSIKSKTKLQYKLLWMGVGNRREHVGVFWSAYNFLFLNQGGHYIDICSVVSYCTAHLCLFIFLLHFACFILQNKKGLEKDVSESGCILFLRCCWTIYITSRNFIMAWLIVPSILAQLSLCIMGRSGWQGRRKNQDYMRIR